MGGSGGGLRDRGLAESCAPRSSVHSLYSQLRIAELRAWMRAGTTPGGTSSGTSPAVDATDAGHVGTAQGPALATAGPGSGLTTLVRLLVRELDLEAVWTWCGVPNVRAVLAGAASSARGVTLRPKIVVVDELDAMDAASLAEVVAFLKTPPPAKVLLLAHSARSQKAFEFARKWPVFSFGRPSEATLHAYLAKVVKDGGLPLPADQDGLLGSLARQAAGDVRAALNALEAAARRGAAGAGGSPALPPVTDFKDRFADPLDVVDDVLCGVRGATLAEGLWFHETDGATVSAGLYENYLSALGALDPGDLRTALLVSESYSLADVADETMFSRQLWELKDACGAVAVAAPAMHMCAAARAAAACKIRSTHASPSPVTKFGSLWSKMYNACAKTKHARALVLAYAQRGCVVPTACELGFVRGMVRHSLERAAATAKCPSRRPRRSAPPDDAADDTAADDTDDDAAADDDDTDALLRRCCWPLTSAQVMSLARLTPGGSAWYKPALHARVKAATAQSAAQSASARPCSTRP